MCFIQCVITDALLADLQSTTAHISYNNQGPPPARANTSPRQKSETPPPLPPPPQDIPDTIPPPQQFGDQVSCVLTCLFIMPCFIGCQFVNCIRSIFPAAETKILI